MQPGMNELVFAVGQGRRALVHGFGQGLVHQVDNEFVSEPDVPGGVFGCAVVPIARRQADNRWRRPQHIEEAKRSRVDRASWTEGGHEGNGAGGDETGENRIRPIRILAF